jgi:hypothetical protein
LLIIPKEVNIMKKEEINPTEPTAETVTQPTETETEQISEENLENVTGGIFDRSYSKKFA